MTQYIDKAAIVAEIEKRIKEIDEIGTYLSPKGVLTNLMCHLDTLKVKEVDFEKVFNDEYSKFSNNVDAMDYGFPIDLADYKDFAKHFFELGLKTKGDEQ